MSDPLLDVDRLTVTFGALKAVDDVTFSIEEGSITGIIGPNGAGKSTLLSAIAGRLSPRKGRISFNGDEVSHLSMNRRCNLGICMTHQLPRPFESITVRQNLEIANAYGGHEHRENSIAESLSMCDLTDRAEELAGMLRPSELRRLELARAYATRPSLLLVDEVAAGMPQEDIEQVRETLLAIRDSGTTLIMVEHVMHAILPVVERLIVLDGGGLLADGEPSEVVRRDDVVDAYFGSDWHD